MPTNVFISYSHADEKALERLHKHLSMLKREGELIVWSDHKILPGGKFGSDIDSALDNSIIFLALLSPDYLASNYCYEIEFKHALEMEAAQKIQIVPVIIEPCDWQRSPFGAFKALPKDGQAVSEWTNPNNAFLDVVTGLRKLIESGVDRQKGDNETLGSTGTTPARRPRVKQDFDYIQKSDFADKAFDAIKDYFKASCSELNGIGDTIRAKFEIMNPTAFTCTVVNRAKRSGGEAHITVRNTKGRHFGNISYVNQSYAESNTSNGTITVAADDFDLYLTLQRFTISPDGKQKYSPKQVAEHLWNDFVSQAGIEYE